MHDDASVRAKAVGSVFRGAEFLDVAQNFWGLRRIFGGGR